MKSFLEAVEAEAARAVELHGDFRSLHEAYAVLLEEVDEFWEQVKKRSNARDHANMRTELVQIAAMCAKTIHLLDTMDAVPAEAAPAEVEEVIPRATLIVRNLPSTAFVSVKGQNVHLLRSSVQGVLGYDSIALRGPRGTMVELQIQNGEHRTIEFFRLDNGDMEYAVPGPNPNDAA